jgi:hypothetical protein
MTPQMYDAQAGTIKVKDISTNRKNRSILQQLINNVGTDYNVLYIESEFDEEDEEDDRTCYVPDGAKDIGWLGYFIGRNDHLDELHVSRCEGSNDINIIGPFYKGVSNNESIGELHFGGIDLLDGRIFTLLCPFFKNNDNLTSLNINCCSFGVEGHRAVALAIRSSTSKSLTEVKLTQNDGMSNEGLVDDELVDIITALSMHPNLQELSLFGSCLNIKGCMALSTLLSCTMLKSLDLSNNKIDDEGIDALVPAFKTSRFISDLVINNNQSITTKGWQHLASILEAPSNLGKLYCALNNVDDEAVTAFTHALNGNRTLSGIYLFNSITLTRGSHVYHAFWKLLCDTTSINATFLSNHTLQVIYTASDERNINGLLTLNEREDKKEVAMVKILTHHTEFDVTAFFEWEFKMLPVMISWFERASATTMPENYEPNIEPRKLSSIYQFVRGMPLLYVETRLKKELDDIKASESKMEEEEQHGLEEKPLDLETKYQLSQKRKRSITERLDQRL